MNIAKTETDHGSTVIVSGGADLRDAAQLKAALIECLDGLRPTTLDVSAIERADVPLLQLVFSAIVTFRNSGIPLSLTDDAAGSYRRTALAAGFEVCDSEES